MSRSPAERTGRGRQAEARRNDACVLDAARVVFAAQGPDAPMSAVAAEAGVGMGSLYRRFATKDELLEHLFRTSLDQQIAAASAALAETDPWAAVETYVCTCVQLRVGVFSAFAGKVPVSAQTTQVSMQAHRMLGEVIARAQAAGVLRPDAGAVDVFQLIELFSRRQIGDDATRLIALMLEGLRFPGHRELPGDTPTWSVYGARWNEVTT
jgi:AcrR family transcriptional regulator